MSKANNPFSDILDPRTESKASHGVAASRKAELSKYEAPLSALDAHGIEVPHRTFKPEEATEYPTDQHFDDGATVHLFQDVREQSNSDEAFGDFGAAEDDTDDVVWTVVDLTDGTVTLTVVGDWGKRREVAFEGFLDDYEPLFLTNGAPRYGY